MSTTNTTPPTPTTGKSSFHEPKTFGIVHLLIRFLVVLVVSGVISYLESAKHLNLGSDLAKLMVPACVGLALAIANWKYLRKISILVLPVVYAASMAIFFGGIFLISMFDLEESSLPVWAVPLVEYLPAAIAGHWLYSVYSRLAKSQSFWGYIMVVALSVLNGFMIFTADVVEFSILQTAYFTLLSTALSLVHWGRAKL